jgi:hypothetical protein
MDDYRINDTPAGSAALYGLLIAIGMLAAVVLAVWGAVHWLMSH